LEENFPFKYGTVKQRRTYVTVEESFGDCAPWTLVLGN